MNQLALIAKTQTLIAAGDIVGAESALVELADTALYKAKALGRNQVCYESSSEIAAEQAATAFAFR